MNEAQTRQNKIDPKLRTLKTENRFWLQPANRYWLEQAAWSEWNMLAENCMVAEDEPWRAEDDDMETAQKVHELQERIETLERQLRCENSPLEYVIKAVKEKARYGSPEAAFELFQQQDYIYRDCQQWRERVDGLKEFLLREKAKALLPPSPSANYPTDQQMADAISSINGEGQPLGEYQNWLGVCCYASARCGYPMDLKMCCEKLKQLPYRGTLYREVKFENIRAFSNWKFVKAGYEQWPTYKTNDQDRTLFIKCRDTAVALDNALINIFR